MKKLFCFVFVLFMAGCVPTQMQKFNQLEKNDEQYFACRDDVYRGPEVQRLQHLFAIEPGDRSNYLQAVNNSNYVTVEEINDIYKYRKDISVCDNININGKAAVFPSFATLESQYATNIDKIFSEVVQKRITVGKANELFYQNYEIYEKDMYAAADSIDNQYQKKRAEAAHRRQEIERERQNNFYKQQMINSMNKPVNTNCFFSGNAVNCTSN